MTPKFFNINGKDGKEIATEINNIVDSILKTNSFPKEYSSIDDEAVNIRSTFEAQKRGIQIVQLHQRRLP